MAYVMVPVPEEHAEEISQYVLSLSLKAKLMTWPATAAAPLLERTDAVDHELMRTVGRANRVWLPISEVTEATGLSTDEVLSRIEAINERCVELSASYVLMVRDDGMSKYSIMFSHPARAPIMELLDPPEPAASNRSEETR